MDHPDPELAPKAKTKLSRNARIALICSGIVAGMTGLAFASVPLYQLFCQVTGFDGTTMRADAPSKVQLERTIDVRFDTNVRGLPWTFKAEQTRQTIKIGETGLAFFKVTNTSNKPIAGMASYNVVPEGAGPHFMKMKCFCFESQTLQPGQTMEFPVAYFIDPELATDPEAKGIEQVTLSYTFFPDTPES